MRRLKTEMNNHFLGSECGICLCYLISPNLSTGRAAKCFLIHVFCGNCDFINGYISPFNDLFATPKNLILVSFFFFMKINPHLLFLSTAVFPVMLYILQDTEPNLSLTLKIHTNQERLQWHADCALLYSIHNNSRTAFAFLTVIRFGVAIFTLFLKPHGNSQLIAHYNI